jgi:hemerythrin-like domain-containing protein
MRALSVKMRQSAGTTVRKWVHPMQDVDKQEQTERAHVAIDARDPLAAWNRAHEEQLQLCRELEAIADSLPASINKQKCIDAAKLLGPMIKGAHHFEEKELFPSIERQASENREIRKSLERLRLEHFEDECFAEELTERLLLLGSDHAYINLEATGYMLRGFFEGIRRHIAFEREHLMQYVGSASR